jgi:hypothetical protein
MVETQVDKWIFRRESSFGRRDAIGDGASTPTAAQQADEADVE